MDIDIVICHDPADHTLAQRIETALRLAGYSVQCVFEPTHSPFRARLALFLNTQSTRFGGLPAAKAVSAASLLDVVAGDMRLRMAFLHPGLLQRWRARRGRPQAAKRAGEPVLMGADELAFEPLTARVRALLPPADPFATSVEDRTFIRPPPRGAAAPVGSAPRRVPSGPPRDPVPDFGVDPYAEPKVASTAAAPVTEPVWLCASAPRQARAGAAFTACLAAYVAAARASALRRVAEFGEPGDRVVSDLAPDGNARWRVGTPVVVRAGGAQLTVQPAERCFEWNGREHALAFTVHVAADAAEGPLTLCFEVEVAGLPMAFIPLRVGIGVGVGSGIDHGPAAAAAQPRVETRVPHSVFACYASKDAAAVTQRLSTLVRWQPGLDVFQDCLDLVPDEAFKPQLATQIRSRDAFVLFWSRHAAASPWVRWEYETARDTKGLAAILPMPLEDPALAPPPPEFADAHWRDRFMLAGYGLAAIQAEASPR